jgi:RNA ligase (TIGR02306 family)
MDRKLVSIQRVEAIEPIAGADNIVKARVLGWDVVVKKNELAAGDLCVFFEIDSVLPDGAPWADFMRPRGFRLKTARLRGVLSQGLALPTSILPDGDVPPIGTDVRERLGVVKYDPPVPLGGDIAGPFPGRVPKTDEIRLQSALGLLDEIRGLELAITTKIDGTSTTFFVDDDGALTACSRNWTLARADSAPWRIAAQYALERAIPRGFAVQGELCGPGIQKNRLGLPAVDWWVFDAYDTRAGRHLDHHELVAFCAERGLRMVPVEAVVDGDAARVFESTLAAWLARAAGLYPGTNSRKEGIVVRPLLGRRSDALAGSRLSFKVLNNDFLLKDED